MVDVKDKAAKAFLTKVVHFRLLLTCLKMYLLCKGSLLQLDPKEKYFLHLEGCFKSIQPFLSYRNSPRIVEEKAVITPFPLTEVTLKGELQ